MMNSPRDLRLLLLEKINGMATAMRGTEKSTMLTEKPSSEMSHAVTVVPMLAPMMTVMDCTSVSSPALTKLTTITVVALDDWMSAVMSSPVSTPVTRFLVMAVRMERKRLPAIFCSPSLIIFIPYRNRPSEPTRARKSKNV